LEKTNEEEVDQGERAKAFGPAGEEANPHTGDHLGGVGARQRGPDHAQKEEHGREHVDRPLAKLNDQRAKGGAGLGQLAAGLPPRIEAPLVGRTAIKMPNGYLAGRCWLKMLHQRVVSWSACEFC